MSSADNILFLYVFLVTYWSTLVHNDVVHKFFDRILIIVFSVQFCWKSRRLSMRVGVIGLPDVCVAHDSDLAAMGGSLDCLAKSLDE